MNNKAKIFTELVEKNQGIIHKVCRIYTDDKDSHDDLFQEIVLQLWRSYDSFKGDSKFSTWMYRVSLNTAITLIRKKTKSSETDFNEAQFLNLKSEDKDEFLEERITLLYAAIRLLNDVERALVLLFLEDLPYKDIAETLGISEVNARVKMNRVKIKLKEIMSKMEQ
ncbi:sigma-70 family RNA polymerase sigma factor [Empedobacter falsenii]|uniref:Sigma-70 family RNA polymerase sigma factor n=1 Tax=Empedobacter falsenii TaxID=343874 RepID=A0A7H9DTP7_9FLAO|nr:MULTISPECIES: sigma-70 family RNA polymerase sigma factor [Empedobacter]HAR72453.1 RNA polymerase subunit sigma-70 [Flavobacteriaceae bacterium]MDH2208111.1 sigma-70 family RNA polymerase sigma factor [Empedobacter sp. GD03644]MDM1041979.1 sigma-70 family RNA polymerase sigma factor [Empedobacter brevis]MDM1062581.1 sigma-70 family RNA polymerase sigma factor [Empedobacter falsenii]MDM1135910.1 sigma-70 family RNA polymerase sigma factor [Empedobacter sp. R750]